MTPKTWPSYRNLAVSVYDASGRCNQSGALISGDGATHSPLSLAMVQYFPAVLDLPYCQSFARFFSSMVWNPCKPAVFLPYCQSFARFLCNVVNIHRYRPNGEFLCNDRSDEDAPAHLQTKSYQHCTFWMDVYIFVLGRFTCHVERSLDVFQKNSPFTSFYRNRLVAWMIVTESSCRLSCSEGTDRRCKHLYQFVDFASMFISMSTDSNILLSLRDN